MVKRNLDQRMMVNWHSSQLRLAPANPDQNHTQERTAFTVCWHHRVMQRVLKINSGIKDMTGCRAMKAALGQKTIALAATASVDLSVAAELPGATHAKKAKLMQAMNDEPVGGRNVRNDNGRQ